MHRFYADEAGVTEGQATLAREDAQHAVRVLRLKAGETIELFAGEARYRAELTDVDPETVRCRVIEALPTTEAGLRITLYQGLPKADKMELIAQKATELGAVRIVPVAMSRCVVQLTAKDAPKKQERWQKIVREATKQSGRCVLPQVALPITMKQLPAALAGHEAAIVPWEDARGYGLAAFRAEHPDVRDIAIVIGPEGGMSPE